MGESILWLRCPVAAARNLAPNYVNSAIFGFILIQREEALTYPSLLQSMIFTWDYMHIKGTGCNIQQQYKLREQFLSAFKS